MVDAERLVLHAVAGLGGVTGRRCPQWDLPLTEPDTHVRVAEVDFCDGVTEGTDMYRPQGIQSVVAEPGLPHKGLSGLDVTAVGTAPP